MSQQRELDCFYTNESVAKDCLQFLKQTVGKLSHDLWIEPSAGSGSFLNILPEPRIGLDIMKSNHSEMEKANFLSWEVPSGYDDIIVVGNPPFGKNASLAVQFFNHAASFANRIAMIVPRTFQKESLVNRLHEYMHLENEKKLRNDSFTFKGQPYAVPCVFQVWSKKSQSRPIAISPRTHQDFAFVDSKKAKFAIQRVGANAGRIKSNINEVAPSSHYFVKPQNANVLHILKSIDWSEAKHKTAGNPSLAKTEVVYLYEEHRKQLAS